MTSTDTTKTAGRGRGFAVPLFALAYVLSTALSSNTSWRYFGDRLHVTNVIERASMFAVLEVMLLACTMGARANLHNPAKGKPGAPGYLVWAFAVFGSFPAYSVGGGLTAGTVRLVLGPVVSVIAFHLALGLELRHADPDAKSNSMQAVIARELQQRIFARLGLATRNLSALEISQARAVERAAVLSGRISALSERRRAGRSGRRLTARLQRELRRAGVSDSAERSDALLSRLAVAQHAAGLSDLTLRSPWADRPAVVTEPEPEPAAEIEPKPEPVPPSPDFAELVGAIPPSWADLTVQAAVERADAILTGRNRSARALAELLAELGVPSVNEGNVRTARSRARARAADVTADQNVIPLQHGAHSA